MSEGAVRVMSVSREATTLIGTKEVADILQIHERTALRLMQRGLIQAFQLSSRGPEGYRGVWRTTRHHVLLYVDNQIKKAEVVANEEIRLNERTPCHKCGFRLLATAR